jgi:hypothetical protein
MLSPHSAIAALHRFGRWRLTRPAGNAKCILATQIARAFQRPEISGPKSAAQNQWPKISGPISAAKISVQDQQGWLRIFGRCQNQA